MTTKVMRSVDDAQAGFATVTAAEVGADASGAASTAASDAASALSTHAGAADPHTGYALESALGSMAGLSNPMTTAADLIVGGTSGALARLAKGSDGQVLTVDPTTHLLVWATPSGGATYATPAIVLGTAAAAGAASTGVRSDATLLAFDATTPAAVGTAAVGAATTAARRDHVHLPPTLPMIGGGTRYYGALASTVTNNQADTLNVLYAYPFYVPTSTAFDRILCTATATVTNALARLGIYNDGGGKPGTLLADYGTVAAATAGDKTITIAPTLAAGWYWLCCVGQTAAPNLVHVTGVMGLIGVTAPFSSGPCAGFSQTAISAGLPDPWGSTLTEVVRVPAVYLRAA